MIRTLGDEAVSMGIKDAFLHEILAHPDDDAPRLIYADWLDEHNDPRGEFIRIQCALAQLSDNDRRRWPLEQREQELLREHEAKWRPKGIGKSPCLFRRGFVEEITLFLRDFPDVVGAIFEQTPLRHVCLRGQDNPAEEIERAREEMERRHFTPGLRPPQVCVIGRLVLDARLRNVTQSPLLARLRGLRLAFPLAIEDLRNLIESPHLTNLTDLNLAHTYLTIDDLRFLANAASLTSLSKLNLSGNRLTHEAARVLAESHLLPQLETLHLDSNLLGDAGALVLSEWPALPRLTRLSLGHNQIFATGVKALAESPALRGLISLDLSRNISCDDGAFALASSRWSRLQALNLCFNGVGDTGVRALAHSERLSQLTRLDLTANRVTDIGTRSLRESRGLPHLERIDLQRNDISAPEQQRLRDRFGPFVSC
jgi:uncharacterized protein (TIGR02996 family)